MYYFDFEIVGNIEKILVRTPKRKDFNRLNELIDLYDGKNNADALYQITAEILSDNICNTAISTEALKQSANNNELIFIINKYISFVHEILTQDCLKIPSCPGGEENEIKYECTTGAECAVFRYTGINFIDQQELRVDEWRRYLRDAVISNNSGTKEGREYLEDCWILEQTEPETEALRAKFGKKGA